MKSRKTRKGESRKLSVKSVMEPKSIAVIGASKSPGKVGHTILRNLIIGGFTGRIYAVNPNAGDVLGLKAHKSVLDIRERVDCAIIAIPAPYVKKAVLECARKGVSGMVLVTGGFREIGEGRLEDEIAAICRKNGIAMIGPNCLGIINVNKSVDSIFLPIYKMKRPLLGGISFVMQSGAVGSTVLDLISESNIGVSKFISYGNAAVLDESDFVKYLREDAETKVIVLYVEGVKDGRRFYGELKEAAKVKPVVVLKAGKGELASIAAKSHTGALAGNYTVFSSMLRQAGAVEAENLESLLNLSKIFLQPLPKGDRVLIITNGGGDGVLAVDAVERNGLKLAKLSGRAARRLKRAFPKHVVVGNPLDLTGDADGRRYRKALEEAIREEGVDSIIAITLFQTAGLGPEVVHEVVWANNSTDKTIVCTATGGEYTKMLLKIIESYNVPAYESPEDSVDSIAKAVWYSRKRGRND